MIKFPKDFLWGSAASSYQVEGGNKYCDWWEYEEKGRLKFKSGEACRHYGLFKDDFDMAASLGHNAHRLSIEWSRIEPFEGKFMAEEIEHYVNVIDALRSRGIEPVVTLHHFTNPVWFMKKGGWLGKDSVMYFKRYVEKLAEVLCGKVRFWVTINEPMVYIYHSYVLGIWPPMEASFSNLKPLQRSMVASHVAAYRAINAIYAKKGSARPMVSIAHSVQYFDPYKNLLKNRIAAWARNQIYNFDIIDDIMRERALDFIGLNYYSRYRTDVKGWGIKHFLTDKPDEADLSVKKNSLGWDIVPQGLYELLLNFKKYRLPLFILENGICTEDDSQRWDFIKDHVSAMHAAMEKGAPVIGYLYWSFMDNFEWAEGYAPRFGLVGVDYTTFKRTVRESAKKFAVVCRTGELDIS